MSPSSTLQLDETHPSAHTETPQRRVHYPGLDGLRGVAILAVFLSHYSLGHTNGNAASHLFASVLDAGWVGVDLFFVLSGFLITGILLDTADRPKRVANFYARRALRIFPVFYGVLAVFLLLTPILHLHWKAQHLLYFFYLSNMIPVLVSHPVPIGRGVDLMHFWSLAVEEQFYLIWPLIVWSIRDRRLLLRIAMWVMGGTFLLRVILVLRGVDAGTIYQLLATRADSLICGSALAIAMREPACPRPNFKWLCFGTGLGVLAIFGYCRSSLHQSVLMSTAGYSLLALFFTCAVYFAQQEGSWLRGQCERKSLRFVGRYSYGLYIYHGVLIVYLIPLFGFMQTAVHSRLLAGLLYIPFAFAVSLLVAMLSFHLLEQPILKLKRHFA